MRANHASNTRSVRMGTKMMRNSSSSLKGRSLSSVLIATSGSRGQLDATICLAGVAKHSAINVEASMANVSV